MSEIEDVGIMVIMHPGFMHCQRISAPNLFEFDGTRILTGEGKFAANRSSEVAKIESAFFYYPYALLSLPCCCMLSTVLPKPGC